MATLNISFSLLPNALHAEFHNLVVSIVERLGADCIGLEPDVIQAYIEVVRQETARVTTTRKSAYTERLRKLDKERDMLLGAILSRLRYAELSPHEAVQAAAPDILLDIVKNYPCSIKRAGALAKSGLVGALLADLGHINADVLGALGVDWLAAELERANSEHMQMYLRRNKEQTERGKGVMPPLRAEADRLYRRLCIEATYIAGRSDEALRALGDNDARTAAVAQRDSARHFIVQLQEHIDYYKAYYLRRHSVPHHAAAESTEAAETVPNETTVAAGAESASPSAPQ